MGIQKKMKGKRKQLKKQKRKRKSKRGLQNWTEKAKWFLGKPQD
jgi:hypothetical protein